MNRTVRKLREFLMNFADDFRVEAWGTGDIVVRAPGGENAGIISDKGMQNLHADYISDTYCVSLHGWTCFHCGQTFKRKDAARNHFGPTVNSKPGCQIDVAEYRRLEVLTKRQSEDDTELHRLLATLRSEAIRKVRRAEEDGYARGVKDMGDPETFLEVFMGWGQVQRQSLLAAMRGALCMHCGLIGPRCHCQSDEQESFNTSK